MRHFLLIITLTLYPTFNTYSQSNYSWEDYIERFAQSENIDDGSNELLYENLNDIYDKKLDINTCSRSQLESLPFLSAQQVMDIIEYRDKVGRIESNMELYLIESLDRNTIQMLNPFLKINPPANRDTIPNLKNVFKYGKNTILADFNVPFYTRKGCGDTYLGYKYKHWLRYSFTYGQKIRFGATVSQDAGEPFFTGKNRLGYDYYSAYLVLRDINRLKALAVGRYRLRFGMGLIMNNGFGFGKLASISTIINSSSHVFGHGSRSDYNYLQGFASTFRLSRQIDVTAFASYRKIDATLNDDSSSVATILKSGYHRTKTEMNKKGNTSVALLGGNINWMNNGFHAGLTGYYTCFDRKLNMSKSQLYRQWYPYGYDFRNISIDYGYISRKLSVNGETAIDKNNQIATINTISYEFTPRLTLMALQRYYPYKYQAIYSNTIAEGGSANDESGLMIGGKITTWNRASLTLYSDLAYFAWPKFNTSGSTYRLDNFLQLDASHEKWSLLLRCRMKMKEHSGKEAGTISRVLDTRSRAVISYSNGTLTLKTQSDYVTSHENITSRGFMFSQSMKWQNNWISVFGLVGYFHTDDFNSRVYIYDPGLLYTFSFPSFYGKGLRISMNGKVAAKGNLTFVLKGSYTRHFDRNVISSGLQQINGSTMSDIETQVQWKF